MDIRAEFDSSLKNALKTKDQTAISTIRLIMAALKDRDIEERGKGHTDKISDSDILSMLQSMIKQRKESIKTYEDAGRTDLADIEKAEIVVIERFLPKQLSEDEVDRAIQEVLAEIAAADIKDMGKVMNELKQRYAGQIDMGRASGLVKKKLS